MAKKSFLDSIQIPAPCSKDWDEMTGDDQKRFCRACAKDVYNLSAMPRREARRFAALNAGKVCVRYVRLPNGQLQTADTGFYKITRRVCAVAAGVFGATLTLSAVVNAQTQEPPPKIETNKAVKTPPKNNAPTSRISFTIYDSTGAFIANAVVKLTNEATKEEFSASTDREGLARFDSLAPGSYYVKALAPNFVSSDFNLQIKEQVEPNVNVTLQVGSVGEFVVIEVEIPLFFAIMQEKNAEVKAALNSGFDLHTKNKAGQTALHIAVDYGNLEIVRLLLERGAEVNIKDKNRQTPLLMLEDNLEEDDQNSLAILRLLIAKGANVNERNEEKKTVLMMACIEENLKAVEILLKAGANPHLKDEDDETALEKTDSEEIKQLLKQYGAK